MTLLERARKEKDLSQAELGRMCDVSRHMINDIEKKRRKPSAKVAEKISNVLGYGTNELFDVVKKFGFASEVCNERDTI